MKVTFSASIGHKMTATTLANRILTQNLLRNEKLDVKFNLSPLGLLLNVFKELKQLEKDSGIIKQFKSGMGLWRNEGEIFLVTIKHTDAFLSKIKGEYFLYSMGIGVFDLIVIKRALEKGLKVIVGGGYALHLPFETTRKYLREMGCSEKLLKNLILVKGYVDLYTDIHKIIQHWKDCTIDETDFGSFWECKTDYFNRYLKMTVGLWNESDVPMKLYDKGPNWHHSYVAFTLSSKCWWSKCKFCLYTDKCGIEPIKYASEDYIVKQILDTLELHKSNAIYFSDDYFLFNEKNERIIKKLKDNGIRMGIYSGITMLKNKEYVKKISNYMTYVNIGLESTSDFTLDYISKGYKKKDVIDAFDNVIENCSTDVTFWANIIFDLPYYDINDFWSHIETLETTMSKMRNNGFRFVYNPRLLSLALPISKAMIDNNFIRESTFDDTIQFGRSRIWKYFSEKYNVDKKYFKNSCIPFKRYDKKGELLQSDCELLNDDQLKYLGGFH